MVVLAAHLNWRTSSLSRNFHDAEQASAALALKKLAIKDLFVEMDHTPFDGLRQSILQDCMTAKDRSDKAIKKCVTSGNQETFSEPFIEHAWDGGTASESDQVPFHARNPVIGLLKGKYVGGLPTKDVLAGGSPKQTMFLSVDVTVEEPAADAFHMVFASDFPHPSGISEEDTPMDDIATYYSPERRDDHLELFLNADLQDRILNAAARQGFAASDWTDAFRQLRTKYQSQLYTLPLLSIDVPAVIVSFFLVLISTANLFQFNQDLRLTLLKASQDPQSDEQIWLKMLRESKLLALGNILLPWIPLVTLAICVPVWLRQEAWMSGHAVFGLTAAFAAGLIIFAATGTRLTWMAAQATQI